MLSKGKLAIAYRAAVGTRKDALALAKGLARMVGEATVKPVEVKVATKPVANTPPKPMPARPSVFKARGGGASKLSKSLLAEQPVER